MSEYEYSDDGEYDYAIEVENAFYEAEDNKRDNPSRALELFDKVVRMESDKRPDEIKWRFKSLEHIVGLHFIMGNSELMVSKYEELLACLDSVTRNECNDTINNILDIISSGNSSSTAPVSLSRMYEITLDVLKKASNERLWFNTNLKLAKMYLENTEFKQLSDTIDTLHESLRIGASKDDPNKEAYLLEVYALEISMYSATGQKSKLKEIYPKTKALSAAIQDPRIMGGIHEAGGKMRMEEESWSDAYDEFFEGFRNYQEAGNPRAKQCLKYVVLANMIALKDINPFDSREAKVYKDDPEIQEMVRLRQAFESSDAREFESLLSSKRSTVTLDPFIMRYVSNLLTNIRSEVLMKTIRPFKRATFYFLAKEINVPVEDVESILIQLILNKKINARIDQQTSTLENLAVISIPRSNISKYAAIERWADEISNLTDSVATMKMSGV